MGYRRCDFEDGLCDWDLASLSPLKWKRTNQGNISEVDPLKGPGRDHSVNSATGTFYLFSELSPDFLRQLLSKINMTFSSIYEN